MSASGSKPESVIAAISASRSALVPTVPSAPTVVPSRLIRSDDGSSTGGAWVVGLGADYDFADISLGTTADLEEVWRIKFRGGYKIGPGLAYGTAGYANADTDTLGDDDGYFIGAGYEQRLTPSFSLGGEVLYHEFDNFNATPTDIETTTVQVRGTFRF